MGNTKLMDSWSFNRKLPEPFVDYSDDAVFKDIYSKYCTQPQKKSTLHAATLRAILAYMELENPSGAIAPESLGAIGSQGNNYTIAEYPSKTGELHVVIFNRLTGKFISGRYQAPPDTENVPEKYILKEKDNSGAALLFALMPTALADDEFNEYYQKLKEHRENAYTDIQNAAETAALLCDNFYRRVRYSDALPVGGIKTDTPSNGVIPNIKPFNIQKGIYSPTNVLHGACPIPGR